jgi:hypothetical protein
MAELAAAYAGNALCSRAPITLPEPMANRAQSVARSVVLRWLRGVAERDQDGYAVLAGNGRTVLVLYNAQQAAGAAVTRGPGVASAVEALATLHAAEGSDLFVMTYPLGDDVAQALSGLFARPAIRELCDDPGPQLKQILADRLDQCFSGAVVVRAAGLAWAVLLLRDGEVVGCYGSDDARLKPTIEDASALFYVDEVEVAVYPAREQPELAAVLRQGDRRGEVGERNTSVEATELGMIALLSALESRLTNAQRFGEGRPEQLALAVAESYDEALMLTGVGRSRLLSDRVGHPLLEAHWDVEAGRVDTQRLLETLRMASISDAWLAAAEALIVALELAVEQQLTWVSLVDESSSNALQEALVELLAQARGLIRTWRAERDSGAAGLPALPRTDALALSGS